MCFNAGYIFIHKAATRKTAQLDGENTMHQNQADALNRHLALITGKEPSRISAAMWNKMNHIRQRKNLSPRKFRLPGRPQDTAADEKIVLEALLSQVILGEKNSKARLLDQIAEWESQFDHLWQSQRDVLAASSSCPLGALPVDEQVFNDAFEDACRTAWDEFAVLRQVATAAKRVKAPRQPRSAATSSSVHKTSVLSEMITQLRQNLCQLHVPV